MAARLNRSLGDRKGATSIYVHTNKPAETECRSLSHGGSIAVDQSSMIYYELMPIEARVFESFPVPILPLLHPVVLAQGRLEAFLDSPVQATCAG